MKRFILFSILIFLVFCVFSQNQEIPYTLHDRERLIRVEERLDALNGKIDNKFETLEAKFGSLETRFDALESKMDIKFDNQQRQLNDIKALFYLGFSVLIALLVFMLGYMIWDRRTALKPALDAAKKAEEKTKNIFAILRDYAQKNPDFAEIMKTYGLF